MRARVLVAAAAIILSGCSNAFAPRTPLQPLRPITAAFPAARGAPSVTAVQFLDARHGWIGVTDTPYFEGQKVLTGGALLRTSDGGRTWQVVAHTKLPILAIDFSSPQDGFVLAGAWLDATTQFTLYRSADGGGTLQELSHPQADAGKAGMQFSSPAQGFVVSQNTLDITTDGGRTWRTASAQPKPGSFGGPMPFAPGFLSATTGFTAWGNGLLRTTDSGASWQRVYSLPTSDNAYGPVTFATPQLGYAEAWINTPPPDTVSTVVLRTDDGGASWRVVSGVVAGGSDIGTPPPNGPADALAAWGQEDVAMAMQGVLYVSRDGGVTWKAVAGPQLNMTTGDVFTYDPEGELLTDDIDGNLMRLTPDDTWQSVWPTTALARVDFTSASQGFALTRGEGRGRLLRTVDGGRTWSTVSVPGRSAPTDLTFASARSGWILRADGERLLATADAGRTWRPLGPRNVLTAQLFGNAAGYVLARPDIAKPPVLLATPDGGRRFVRRSLPRGLSAGGMVRFATPQVGFAASNDALWRTDDGGGHWHNVPIPAQIYGFLSVVSMTTDPSGDLWLLVASSRAGGMTTPQAIGIRHPDGAWQEVQLPGVEMPFDATGESLDACSRRQAWLATPAGVFATTDGGRTWQPVAPGP